MPVNFIHLKVHTEYSLTNGLVRIKPLIAQSVSGNMPAVAITDQSNLCALVKFYKSTRGAGIKPIVGVDIWLENETEPASPHRMTLLAKNDLGYRNMTVLISKAEGRNISINVSLSGCQCALRRRNLLGLGLGSAGSSRLASFGNNFSERCGSTSL